MAKTMTFDYDGKTYTLEFTRRSIVEMESRGFNPSDVGTKPLTALPTLFRGAFLAHHRGTSQAVIDDIYSKLPDKEDLIKHLAEMYAEPIETLMAEPKKAEAIEWSANF